MDGEPAPAGHAAIANPAPARAAAPAALARQAGGRAAALAVAAAIGRDARHARLVILVEGVSDRLALAALAERSGRDLTAAGVHVVPMGGATNIGHFAGLLGPRGLGVPLAGLCDAGEEGDYRRGLARAGLGPLLTRADLERAGFFVCDADLEDELIRSLGVSAVQQVLAGQGDLASFRRFQRQPYQRLRPCEAQLRRFLGTRSGRKAQYARLLAEALEPGRVPRPLQRVLALR